LRDTLLSIWLLLLFQTQLAQKTTLISDSKLKEQELREQVQARVADV
jgi:hypothetical protein